MSTVTVVLTVSPPFMSEVPILCGAVEDIAGEMIFIFVISGALAILTLLSSVEILPFKKRVAVIERFVWSTYMPALNLKVFGFSKVSGLSIITLVPLYDVNLYTTESTSGSQLFIVFANSVVFLPCSPSVLPL